MITEKLQLQHRHVKTPYKHQRENFERTRSWKYYAFFWEMGTGKTKPMLDTIAWLFLKGEIDGALIISDMGSYRNWPINEIPTHFDPSIPRRMATYWSGMGKRQREECEDILTAKDDLLDFAFINIEALSSKRGYEWARCFVESHYAMTIIDESTSIKNPKSLRSRAAHDLGRRSDYRRIATGTPVTQGPLDLYSQCEFLEPGLLGHRTFVSFRSHYAILRDVILGTRRFKIVAGYVNLEELEARLRQFSSRITKKECLDLPDKVYETQFVEMSERQLQIYTQLRDEAVVMLQSGMLSSTSAITTVEKLHQICCGHVKDDDGNVTDLESNRMDILLELLENHMRKTIIWCHYQRDVELVSMALREKFQKDGYFPVMHYGKTPPDERVNALDLFVNNARCLWFIGTPSTGGKGLTLTVASDVIYYSCGYNLEHRLQSEDRCHRIGQTNKVTYVDLTTVGTVEQRILKALTDKKSIAHEILDQRRLMELLTGI